MISAREAAASWEDDVKDALPRAEAWLRGAAPAIAARLGQPG